MPVITFGLLDEGRYAYENSNWLRYDLDKRFAGFWSLNDEETGQLNALGFLEEDVQCTNYFKDSVEDYHWKAIVPGTEVKAPKIPEDNWLKAPEKIKDHVHLKLADTWLLVLNALLYVTIIGLCITLLVWYCRERKAQKG